MTTPKTQFPVVPAESYTPGPRREPDAGAAPRTPRLTSTAHVGLVFLVLTLVGFIALGAALPHYTLSSTARRGLTYDTLFAELHDALVDEPDRPLRRAIQAVQVDAVVPAPRGYAVVTFDTLAVADATVYPSLEAGGFLHDEIDRFNAFQRERVDAVRRGRLTGGSVLDLRAAENPSIFRTEIHNIDDLRGERDTIVLTDRAVPYDLRVPSPFDAARLVAVTTREWSRNIGWISGKGTEAVRGSGRIPGVPPCPFRAVRDSVYVECTAPGSPFAQLVLRFPDRLGETGTATLFTSERTLYDGKQLPARQTMPIGTGGMFQFHSRALTGERRVRAEPVILEWTLARDVRRNTVDQRAHPMAAKRVANVAVHQAARERRRVRGQRRARRRPEHTHQPRRDAHRRAAGGARRFRGAWQIRSIVRRGAEWWARTGGRSRLRDHRARVGEDG